MILFNIVLFLFSSVILFYVVRYRIHIHVTYQPRSSSRRATAAPKPPASPARAKTRLEPPQPSFAPGLKQAGGPKLETSGEAVKQGSLALDLKSALVNLGCKPKRASEVATKISQQFTSKDFNQALRLAIREAA